ncbi:MAG: Maf family protein [bacterium]
MPSPPRPLVLASASPRRQELLGALGVPFVCAPVQGLDEEALGATYTGPAPGLARFLAEAKARLGAQQNPDALVLAADTIVVIDNQVLGKPRDAAEASRFLHLLADRTHQVITGIALADGTNQLLSAEESTDVTFGPLTDAEIATYVATGEPMDKAGAYAIQGGCSAYISGIRGDYFNVVGLPLYRLRQLLMEWIAS